MITESIRLEQNWQKDPDYQQEEWKGDTTTDPAEMERIISECHE